MSSALLLVGTLALARAPLCPQELRCLSALSPLRVAIYACLLLPFQSMSAALANEGQRKMTLPSFTHARSKTPPSHMQGAALLHSRKELPSFNHARSTTPEEGPHPILTCHLVALLLVIHHELPARPCCWEADVT